MITDKRLDLSSFDDSYFYDPLDRSPGDALDPLRHSTEDLLLRKRANERVFAALWQQTPRTEGGMLIKPYEWFTVISPDQLSKLDNVFWVRAWDFAFTEKQVAGSNPDFTACSKVGLWKSNNNNYLVIAEIKRWRESWSTTKDRVAAFAEADGPGVRIAAENQGPQKAAFDEVKNFEKLSSNRVIAVTPVRDKVARAQGWIDLAEAGGILILPGPWHDEFFNECESFPFGSKDDQVDSISVAYEALKPFMRNVTTVSIVRVRGLYK